MVVLSRARLSAPEKSQREGDKGWHIITYHWLVKVVNIMPNVYVNYLYVNACPWS